MRKEAPYRWKLPMFTRLSLACGFAIPVFTSAYGASLVEQYATKAAESANAFHQKSKGPDTISARAYAVGGTTVHENVININGNATLGQISQWRHEVRQNIVSSTCDYLKNDDFFNQRRYQIQYRYLNQHKLVIDDFTINKKVCSDFAADICSVADQRITIAELKKFYPLLAGLTDQDAMKIYRDTFYSDFPYEKVACFLGVSLEQDVEPPKPKNKKLGPIDKWRYESCLMDATKAPTPQGITRGSQLCKAKFEQVY